MEDSDAADPPGVNSGLSFGLNYLRPHFFADEALIELMAIVDSFGLIADDPQIDGMGSGPFQPDAFVSGWEAGNRFASQSVDLGDLVALPRPTIAAMWSWNYGRSSYQEALGELVFVPRIFVISVDGNPGTALAWIDGIAIALPAVDYLILGRDQLAPRGLFGRRRDRCIARWADVEGIISPGYKVDEPQPHHLLAYAEPPADIVGIFQRARPAEVGLVGIPFDKILESDLLRVG
jgi:hypothetical protein